MSVASDDTYEEVYAVHQFSDPEAQRQGTYYQTYGGGPEGGYLVTLSGIWKIHRGWFDRWSYTRCECSGLEFHPENQDEGVTARIRLL